MKIFYYLFSSALGITSIILASKMGFTDPIRWFVIIAFIFLVLGDLAHVKSKLKDR